MTDQSGLAAKTGLRLPAKKAKPSAGIEIIYAFDKRSLLGQQLVFEGLSNDSDCAINAWQRLVSVLPYLLVAPAASRAARAMDSRSRPSRARRD